MTPRQPTTPCPICGCRKFWVHPFGGPWLCNECHPCVLTDGVEWLEMREVEGFKPRGLMARDVVA